jgi:hypothetical protein
MTASVRLEELAVLIEPEQPQLPTQHYIAELVMYNVKMKGRGWGG